MVYMYERQPAERFRYLVRKGRTRQTLLGRSATNQLIIVPPPMDGPTVASPSPPPPDRGILSLPDEVLLNVLEILSVDAPLEWAIQGRNPLNVYPEFVALSIVCRRFHRLVTPFMYHDLSVLTRWTGRPYNMYNVALRHLHRTLGENVALRAHCRRLYVLLDARNHADQIMDMLTWLTSTRHLRIRGDLGENGLGRRVLDTAVRSLPHLESLSLEEPLRINHFGLLQVCGALKDMRRLDYLGIEKFQRNPDYAMPCIKVSLVAYSLLASHFQRLPS